MKKTTVRGWVMGAVAVAACVGTATAAHAFARPDTAAKAPACRYAVTAASQAMADINDINVTMGWYYGIHPETKQFVPIGAAVLALDVCTRP
jgi:hypothetical protein